MSIAALNAFHVTINRQGISVSFNTLMVNYSQDNST
jgi:hypothetical protein